MSFSPHGALIAVHAANEQRRKIEQDEEEMTKYTSEDLDQNWEFKIVRSTYTALRKPGVFQALLEEESLAGWELVEKLDDRRVRFKRRRETRRRDATLPPGLDPYRTQFGTNTNTIGIVVGIISAMLFVGVLVAIGLLRNPSNDSIPWNSISVAIPAVLIVVVGIIMLVTIRARRG